MLKKILIIVAGLLLLGALAIIGYKFLKRQTVTNSNAMAAVPVDAAFVFESADLSSLIKELETNNQIWNELLQADLVSKTHSAMLYLDSIISGSEVLNSVLDHQPVLISAHLSGKEKFDYLFLLNLPAGTEADAVVDFVEPRLNGKGVIAGRTYDNQQVYDVRPNVKGTFPSFSFAVVRGVCIISYSSILVEESVRQLSLEASLQQERGFIKVRETAGKNVDANVYLNFRTFPKLASVFLNEHYSNSLSRFTTYADWCELDFSLKKDAILLNGYTYANDSLDYYLNIFKNQEPQDLSIEEFMPDNTSAFVAFGIEDFKIFEKDYSAYLQSGQRGQDRMKKLEKMKSQYGIDILDVFQSFLEKEVALLYTDVNSNKDIDNSTYVLMKTKSKSIAEEKLIETLKKYVRAEKLSFDEYQSYFKLDDEKKYAIYKMPFRYVAADLFGAIFVKAETRYFTFVDNYLVLANSTKSLERYIQAIVLQKTLKADINYLKFSENLVSRSNFYFYSNIAYSPGLLAAYVNNDLKNKVEENIPLIQKFQGLAVQLSSGNDLVYNNIYLSYNPVFKPKPHTVWESRLDTFTLMKPCLVLNHNTNDKEIFIQDKMNNIYLINSSGRILWKIKLDQPIIGDVYQVDFYKNNKLQLLFNTQDKMHLLDRNGNYVERYPIRFRSEATNGIALFDYEQNRNYRIFVACRNKKIYAYDIEGNVIDGWDFEKSDNLVHNPVQHFRVGDKDYIVFSDSLKTYMLDRRGNARVKLKKQFARAKHSTFSIEGSGDKARLVTTDTLGNICYVYFNGEVKTKTVGEYSSNHFFDYKDLDSDGINDFIFVDGKYLTVIKSNGDEMIKHEFSEELSDQSVFYIFPGNYRKLGVTLRTANEIYLFNSDGSVYDGFPLEGLTKFSIGHLSAETTKFNLIVGSEDGFLYNYEVQE